MSSKMKKLKNEQINPFMEETDPKNPYGPNYEELPFDTKVYYKFNRVKKFVHLSKEDQDTVLNYDFKYFFGTVAAAAIGCLAGYGLKKFVIRPYLNKLDDWIEQLPHMYYGLYFAGGATLAYYQIGDWYIKDVCYPMLDKYLPEAVKNGFDDYEISQFRTVHMEYAEKDKN